MPQPLSSEPEYELQPDGRLVSGPSPQEPTRRPRVGFALVPVFIALAIGLSFFLGFSLGNGKPLIEAIGDRVMEGCIPVVASPHLGTEGEVRLASEADAQMAAVFDISNVEVVIRTIAPGSTIAQAFPEATHLGFAIGERCLGS